jgi:hypothetical protein
MTRTCASPGGSSGSCRSHLRRWWKGFLAGPWQAERRALDLLKENLSPAQREQYLAFTYFDVVGGSTGAHYRIRSGRTLNVEQLDEVGKCVRLLCFVPREHLPLPEVMLTQKVALELFEEDAIRIAVKINPGHFRRSYRQRGARADRYA